MEVVRRSGWMVRSILGSMLRGRNKGRECFCELMGRSMKGSFIRIVFMGMGFILGLMGGNILGIEKIIK